MKPDLSSSFFPLDRLLPVCYIITMEGEKFILYSNRSSNVHVFKYINPEGKEFDLDSREMPKGWDNKLSGHHALVRGAHELVSGTDKWEELLRIPWMKANEEAWGKE
jgi:hypothetical protein